MVSGAFNEDKLAWIITARKRSLRRLCFYRCLSVHTGGGACVVLFGGCAWFYLGGMHGFIWGCVVLFRGAYVVFFGGACMVFPGVHGFSGGACMVFSVFFGYNEIRSMSGRYASYWNAFLLPCVYLFLRGGNFTS